VLATVKTHTGNNGENDQWHHQIVGGVIYTRCDRKVLAEKEPAAVYIDYIAVQENPIFMDTGRVEEHQQEITLDHYSFGEATDDFLADEVGVLNDGKGIENPQSTVVSRRMGVMLLYLV
jgi:hypothetical protein